MHVVVIGLGTFGRAVARALTERGVEVTGIDSDPEVIEEVKADVGQALRLDSTQMRAMREAGLEDVDVAIVAHGENLEASILTTVLLRRLGVPTIIARSMSDLHEEVLREVGADRVVSVERELGRELAESLITPEIAERIPLASGHSIVELTPPAEYAGRTLRDIAPRSRYRVNVVAIRRRRKEIGEGGEVRFVEEIDDLPDPDDVIGEYDRLFVVGSDDAIRRFGAAE